MQVVKTNKDINPLTLNGMIVYADPARGINGRNPVEGESIYRAFDQSGKGNHFFQNSGALQPSWSKTGINGQPTFNFDTASALVASIPISGNEVTINIVYRRRGTAHGGYECPFIVSTSTFLQINHLSNRINFNAQTASLDKTILNPLDLDAHCITIVKSDTQIEYFLDGVSLGVNIGSQNVTGVTHQLGAFYNNLGGNFFNGWIGQFIMWDRPLNASEVTLLNTFSNTKFGI